jgi:hypothetical protein
MEKAGVEFTNGKTPLHNPPKLARLVVGSDPSSRLELNV